ncbi:GntR family transcriptional regulator [Crassaminicella thermophila]|nr:GntR family transcriptional regulator [Crassaminicella thermophila]
MDYDTQNIENKVYKELKHAILTKQFYPNYKLVEATIAEKLGVSRTPVRSAFKKLAYEGLVNIIPRKGAFIAQPTIEEFMQIYSSRLILEKEAAILAAKQMTAVDLDFFKQLLEEEKESYQKRDFEKFIATNNKIHMLIAEASKNRYFIKFINELLTKSNIYLVFYDQFYTKPLEELNSVKEHGQLFKAIKAGDSYKSGQAMEQHIKSIFENLELTISERMNPFHNSISTL